MKFLLAIALHAFSLFTLRHTGKGLPQKVSGGLIATLIACSLVYALHVSPQAGFVKLLVWSVAASLLPAISVATAMLSTFMKVFGDFVGMEGAVRDFWYLTAWLLVVVRIVRG